MFCVTHHDIHTFYRLEVQETFQATKKMLKQLCLRPALEGQGFIVDSNGELKLEWVENGLAPRVDLDYIDIDADADDDDNGNASDSDFDNDNDSHLVTGTAHDHMEGWLAVLLETAIRHVGWVPREIYHFVTRPTTFGMFTMLGAVWMLINPRRCSFSEIH